MDTLETVINNYLEYCNSQKCLDEKTLKAYRIDLRQFSEQISIINIAEITSKTLEQYIARLHEQYKPKTVKRKIASVKALFHYLEYKDIIDHNPFSKILIHFREPAGKRSGRPPSPHCCAARTCCSPAARRPARTCWPKIWRRPSAAPRGTFPSTSAWMPPGSSAWTPLKTDR